MTGTSNSKELRLHSAREMRRVISDEPFYIFVGNNFDPSPNRQLDDSVFLTYSDPMKNMIMGKRIEDQDVVMMIRDVPYEANIVYDMYDDRDPDLFSKNFYVTVSQGGFYHCFKCIENAYGSPSTVEPDFADVTSFDESYQTSDGYRWKYMFTIENELRSIFPLSGLIPLVSNVEVAEVAVAGSIDAIKVENPGSGYDNYLEGTFGVSDIRVGGNTRTYAVTSNSIASSTNGFYNGCVLYLEGGEGAGQYRIIEDYVSNQNGKFVTLNDEFLITPANGTEWRITPGVEIRGTGFEMEQATARAIVNPTGNTISHIEILSRGSGYGVAFANVLSHALVGATPASLRVINPPPGGHGYDVESELGAFHVGMSVLFSSDEDGTVPPEGSFGQLGLIRDPIFRDVALEYTTTGSVNPADMIYFFEKRRVQDEVVAVAGNTYLTSSAGNFLEYGITIGDWICISAPGDLVHLAKVESVNASVIVLDSEMNWETNEGVLCTMNIHTEGRVSGVNPVVLTAAINSPRKPLVDFFTHSRSIGQVLSISRSGVTKGFDTFVQMMKLEGEFETGEFEPDERVFSGSTFESSSSRGCVHSAYEVGGSWTVYLTMSEGNFNEVQLKGENSGAVFTISNKYNGELLQTSGRILHLENSSRMSRSPSQRERINFVINF